MNIINKLFNILLFMISYVYMYIKIYENITLIVLIVSYRESIKKKI